MIKIFKIIFFIVLLLNLTACANTNLLPNRSGKTSLTSDYQSIIDDNIIRAAHIKHVADQGGIDTRSNLNKKLVHIIKLLVEKNQYHDKQIIPILLNSNTVNAYSLSSHSKVAYIYITRGLMNFSQNDSQLASVLAHELSHIQLGHHLKRQQTSAHQFNKAQELEADKQSIKLIAKAGFDQSEAIILLQRLEKLLNGSIVANQADYPSNAVRIKNLRQIIAAI